jgi:membrane protein implicated in regulation of membrane protease activity
MICFWLLVVALMFSGCQGKRPVLSGAEQGESPISAHGEAETPKTDSGMNILKGTVIERLDADRYSYLRLITPSGEMWAAVPQAEVKNGEAVSVVNPMTMNGFESKTLKRKFDKLVFGILDQQASQQNEMQTLSRAHAGISGTPDAEPIRVQRAAGADGRTVAEIFAQKAQLKDRGVAVRGKVVKVNPNIMGKTWVHLRDGTGDATSRTDDLTVTTQSTPAVGDIVSVHGVVRTDKNFGMGYVFPVLVEDATVAKQ